MKKLKLAAIHLAAKEVLTRAQLKHVMGGDDPGSGGGFWCDSNCLVSCQIECNGDLLWGQCRRQNTGDCVCVVAC
jgi:hypothetical protein